MPTTITNNGTVSLDALLLQARTFKAFENREVEDGLLLRIYDLAKFGPTSFNLCPMRIVFARSPEAKGKVEQALAPGKCRANAIRASNRHHGFRHEILRASQSSGSRNGKP